MSSVYTSMCVCVCQREKESERERARAALTADSHLLCQSWGRGLSLWGVVLLQTCLISRRSGASGAECVSVCVCPPRSGRGLAGKSTETRSVEKKKKKKTPTGSDGRTVLTALTPGRVHPSTQPHTITPRCLCSTTWLPPAAPSALRACRRGCECMCVSALTRTDSRVWRSSPPAPAQILDGFLNAPLPD